VFRERVQLQHVHERRRRPQDGQRRGAARRLRTPSRIASQLIAAATPTVIPTIASGDMRREHPAAALAIHRPNRVMLEFEPRRSSAWDERAHPGT